LKTLVKCYHIDTDMGADDGLALALAHARLDDIVAISTVFGNVSVRMATRNALVFRSLLGCADSWNVLEGAGHASDGFLADAHSVHGDDGLSGATRALEPALLSHLARELVPSLASAELKSEGALTIIGLGPATNIPELLHRYGRSAIEKIVLMSGVFFDRGNITPYAEFNAYCDPHALQATLDLGIPVTIVPLDVCRKIQLSRATLAAYAKADETELTRLIVASHMPYMDVYQKAEAIDGCFPHDAITVLVALAPEHFFELSGTVTVECGSGLRGRTTIAIGGSHVKIVTGGELRWVRDILSRPPLSMRS
jgi:purine nucleosidase